MASGLLGPQDPSTLASFLNGVKGGQCHFFQLYQGCFGLLVLPLASTAIQGAIPFRVSSISKACLSHLSRARSAASGSVQIWHQLTFSGSTACPWAVGWLHSPEQPLYFL